MPLEYRDPATGEVKTFALRPKEGSIWGSPGNPGPSPTQQQGWSYPQGGPSSLSQPSPKPGAQLAPEGTRPATMGMSSVMPKPRPVEIPSNPLQPAVGTDLLTALAGLHNNHMAIKAGQQLYAVPSGPVTATEDALPVVAPVPAPSPSVAQPDTVTPTLAPSYQPPAPTPGPKIVRREWPVDPGTKESLDLGRKWKAEGFRVARTPDELVRATNDFLAEFGGRNLARLDADNPIRVFAERYVRERMTNENATEIGVAEAFTKTQGADAKAFQGFLADSRVMQGQADRINAATSIKNQREEAKAARAKDQMIASSDRYVAKIKRIRENADLTDGEKAEQVRGVVNRFVGRYGMENMPDEIRAIAGEVQSGGAYHAPGSLPMIPDAIDKQLAGRAEKRQKASVPIPKATDYVKLKGGQAGTRDEYLDDLLNGFEDIHGKKVEGLQASYERFRNDVRGTIINQTNGAGKAEKRKELLDAADRIAESQWVKALMRQDNPDLGDAWAKRQSATSQPSGEAGATPPAGSTPSEPPVTSRPAPTAKPSVSQRAMEIERGRASMEEAITTARNTAGANPTDFRAAEQHANMQAAIKAYDAFDRNQYVKQDWRTMAVPAPAGRAGKGRFEPIREVPPAEWDDALLRYRVYALDGQEEADKDKNAEDSAYWKGVVAEIDSLRSQMNKEARGAYEEFRKEFSKLSGEGDVFAGTVAAGVLDKMRDRIDAMTPGSVAIFAKHLRQMGYLE